MEPRKPPPSRWPIVIAFTVLGIVLLALIVVGIKSLMSEKSGKPRKPPTVTLLPDRPPPPPPPPKEEKRPEPPKDESKEVKVTQNVEQQAQQPAPSEQLKMEGAAGEGGSPFGSGTVGQDYVGGDVSSVGGAGGFGMGPYATRLQRHFQDHLSRNRKLRGSDYRVVIKLWLNGDGSLERAELAGSTGTESIDELLRESLLQAPAMREAPPGNIAQPIRIRVTNRGAA